MHYGRQDDKRAKTPMYGKHQGQGHHARDARAPLPTLTGLPLQGKRAQAPRHTRHCPAQGIYANMNTTNKNKLLYKTVLVIRTGLIFEGFLYFC